MQITDTAAHAPARWATTSDVPEIVRLGAVMYRAMGVDVPHTWFGTATAATHQALLAMADFDLDAGTVPPSGAAVAAIVDDPGDPTRAVASAIGILHHRLPGPHNPRGMPVGYVQWVATESGFRRRGYARSVVSSLLAWFDAAGLVWVELHATDEGDGLYRDLGFTTPDQPGLRRVRREDLPGTA